MAARLGFPEAAYLLWERGVHQPDLRALPAVLTALGDAPTSPADPSLGARLKAWRQARGVSQAEAAAQIGVDTRTWGTLERGQRRGLPATLTRAEHLLTADTPPTANPDGALGRK